MGLQVGFLFKFFATKATSVEGKICILTSTPYHYVRTFGLSSHIYNVPVAQVTLIMDAYHVSGQTAFAFELLEADTAVVTRTLMLSLDMHVAPSC